MQRLRGCQHVGAMCGARRIGDQHAPQDIALGGMNGAHVKGHLPDANQLVWNTLLDSSGRFLPDAELLRCNQRLSGI